MGDFTRKYSNVSINDYKMQEFRYCSISFTGDFHQIMADALINDNKILSYLRDNDVSNLEFIKAIVEDKISKLKTEKDAASKRAGYEKNDGIFMNFLSFSALEELYDVAPLYLLQRSDIEKPKFGLDSIFFKNNEVYIFEFKTSTQQLNEQKTAKHIYNGVESLFCKGEGVKIASLYDCKATIKNNNLDSVIHEIIEHFIDNRNSVLDFINKKGLKFNVCIISPINTFADDEITKYITEEYLSCKNCSKTECKGLKCPRNKDIKIQDAIHIQLPTEFNLEKLYNELVVRISNGN